MRRVRTVVALSDLHLGRDVGYLCSADARFQGNGAAFLEAWSGIGPQDELIVNGDLLELSVAGLDRAYGDLKEFFFLLSRGPELKRLVYLPGNHDHHLWREMAERACVEGRLVRGKMPPSDADYPSFFVDKSFSSADPDLYCGFALSGLWPKDRPAPEFVVKYPHHLVDIPADDGRPRYYLFTHGHFLEELFTPVNYLIEPARLDELEAFNTVWIEAVNYDFGRTGRLALKVQELLEGTERRDRHSRREVRRVLDEAYLNIARKMNLGWARRLGLRLAKNAAASYAARLLVDRRSGLFRSPINDRLKARIEAYIRKYIIARYRESRAAEYHFPAGRDIPLPFSFVFGHTHTPSAGADGDSLEIDGATYPLANTGGWLRIDGSGAADGECAGLMVINGSGPRWLSLQGRLR
jgi:hypothetical protein